ncbi:MAG: ABC transporter substrate-binding protein [Opitutaceae bacterium]|jgi:phospholipid transport system substrate-binding protein|nr:ABC transporter substrate-binding protein [Opitutaceae bacterium]
MHFARPLRLFLVCCALAGAGRLFAAPVDDARAALSHGIDEVTTALRERPAQDDLVAMLDTLANKHFAFATTTRLAVGPAWRDFTEAERARATELFSRLVVRTYANRLRGETAPDIAYGQPVELRPGRIEIPTTVRSGGANYAIIYRLEEVREAAPAWRVYDVVAEGVSLIANYRSQFDPILRQSGAAGLIRSLEAKLAEPVPAAGS